MHRNIQECYILYIAYAKVTTTNYYYFTCKLSNFFDRLNKLTALRYFTFRWLTYCLSKLSSKLSQLIANLMLLGKQKSPVNKSLQHDIWSEIKTRAMHATLQLLPVIKRHEGHEKPNPALIQYIYHMLAQSKINSSLLALILHTKKHINFI